MKDVKRVVWGGFDAGRKGINGEIICAFPSGFLGKRVGKWWGDAEGKGAYWKNGIWNFGSRKIFGMRILKGSCAREGEK